MWFANVRPPFEGLYRASNSVQATKNQIYASEAHAHVLLGQLAGRRGYLYSRTARQSGKGLL